MKITRRRFPFLFVTCAGAALTFTGAASKPASGSHQLAFIGTYTNKTESKGIYAVEFDSESGKLQLKGVAAETPDPSWVVIHPNGKFVYAANESGKQSTITAFALDAETAKLIQLNQLPAEGEDPCYLSFDKTGKFLFVANYTSGNVVVFPILPDGKLGPHTAVVKDSGTLGPNKERQEAPHAHWVQPSPDNHLVLVADLGLDRVIFYAFDAARGTLSAGPWKSAWSGRMVDPSAKLAPGTGPRHAVFSGDGVHLYVLGELDSTVTAVHAFGLDDFVPKSFQRVAALPKGFSGRNDAAEIALHPNGKFLYTSNRGNDTIAVFNVQQRGGRLTLIATVPAGGQEPRHFALDPSGRFLLAENQNSNSITVFRVDPATGALSRLSTTDKIPSPVCLAFLP